MTAVTVFGPVAMSALRMSSASEPGSPAPTMAASPGSSVIRLHTGFGAGFGLGFGRVVAPAAPARTSVPTRAVARAGRNAGMETPRGAGLLPPSSRLVPKFLLEPDPAVDAFA